MEVSDKKQHRQHKDQQNNNNYETEMGRKITLWLLQVTNCRNLTREDQEMAKKWKLEEKIGIYPNGSPKQRHTDQQC